jgi:ribose-phosphate pyrophosphokinase
MKLNIRLPEDRGWVYEQFNYPAGELQVRIQPDKIKQLCESTEVSVTANIRRSEDLIALCLLTDALRETLQGRSDMELVLPYLPYARADRRFVDGDCYALKVFGQIIDGLAYSQVVTLDAHSPHAKKCIANLVDVSPLPLINEVISRIDPRTVILLPDEGAARYGLKGALQCTKHRDSKTGKLSGFSVPSREKFGEAHNVLIVDDICDGGGTFLGIAEKLEDYGLDLYLYVSHGIFSKGTDELRERFNWIFTSDSFLAQHKSVSYMPWRNSGKGL